MNHSVATSHEPVVDATATTAPEGEDTVAQANLGKIREILFGTQARTTEQRLALLEERIHRDYEHTQRRLGELEKLVQTSMEALGERLKSLRVEANTAQNSGVAEARQAAKSLKQGMNSLDERLERERKEIRETLGEAVEVLRETIRQRHEEALAALDVQSGRLQVSKVDRLALGELLADLSARVSR